MINLIIILVKGVVAVSVHKLNDLSELHKVCRVIYYWISNF